MSAQMRVRERCGLSAMGAALAEHCELGDVLEAGYPRVLVLEANCTLRLRGLVLVAIMGGGRTQRWEVCGVDE